MTVSYTKRLTPAVSALSASPVMRALRAASAKAAEKLAANRADGEEDLGYELTLLSETVYTMAFDEKTEPITPSIVVFSRALIDALRAEFVERLERDRTKKIEAKEIIAVFAAFEELSKISDEPGSTTFSQKLGGDDAKKAVLEIAHDMRSPLSAILFLVETLRAGQSGTVTPVQERQLGLIYGAAFGLSGLASDIIEAGRGNLLADSPPSPVSLTDTIQDICAIVAPLAEEKGLRLQQVYPTVDGRLGHGGAIHRVLLNLTSNALKYTERGSVSIGVTELDDTRVEFWIKDTGRGIPEHVLAMLFTEFRPGSVGMRFSSAGLGLSICRSLLERMNSKLKVDTSPEEGTRFSFVLDLPPV
jgi:signal transduction histidine kinase